jgi:hypothetical protein
MINSFSELKFTSSQRGNITFKIDEIEINLQYDKDFTKGLFILNENEYRINVIKEWKQLIKITKNGELIASTKSYSFFSRNSLIIEYYENTFYFLLHGFQKIIKNDEKVLCVWDNNSFEFSNVLDIPILTLFIFWVKRHNKDSNSFI